MKAKKWVMLKHFDGFPKDSDLELQEEDLPALKDGDVLAEAVYLSVDPYMRPYMRRFPAGTQMIGQQVAKVIESRNKNYDVGTYLALSVGWRSHTVLNPDSASVMGMPLSQRIPDLGDLPHSLALGSVGMPGVTAYFGFLELCQPKEGDVCLVNAAAGAVGSLVGQIAKIKGCKVIGYAGTDEKCHWLKEELGFDEAFNYKTCDLSETLKGAAPDGVDCYFDNVGGDFTSVVLSQHMKLFGRVSICGCITSYNDKDVKKVPVPWGDILFHQLKIEGFIVNRWVKDFPKAQKQMLEWIKEGKLKYREYITEGFENMPKAFYGLFEGKNTGKAIVKV